MKSPDQIQPKSREKSEFNFKVEEITVASELHSRRNEDALLSLPSLGSFAVFDGIGGRNGGDIASRMARDGLREALESLPNELSFEERCQKIKEILVDINNRILQEAQNRSFPQMGTTVSFVQFCKDKGSNRKIIVANAGDSRVYILRNNEVLEQLTVDDNDLITPELRLKFDSITDASELTETGMESWKKQHHISNRLGFSEFEPKIQVFDLQSNDTVIITSDGVHDNLTTQEIADIVKGVGDNSLRARRLVQAAQKRSRENVFRSKPDDMTALVISETS